MNRLGSVVAGIVLVLACMGIVAGLYQFTSFWMGAAGSGQPERSVFYEVKKNQTPLEVLKDLQREGVVSDARLFYWYGRFTGRLSRFKAGDYRFSTHMKPDEIFNVVTSGVSYGFPLTIPEGYTMDQIAVLVDKLKPGAAARFLALVRDQAFIKSLNLLPEPPRTLEGFLFPETYLVTRQMPVEDIVRQMTRKYRSVMDEKAVLRAKELGFTEYQLLTLASVVERETGAPEDRPKVSSVFHNRLRKRMKLQSDPTVIYGIKNYNGNITKKDLLTPHPWNTYTIPALPLTPIGNPGREAINATLHPPESKYLYFVSHGDGTTEFSETLHQHNAAVQKYQVDRRAREGKSWRDLSKRSSPAAPH